jgi:hypothetical protein
LGIGIEAVAAGIEAVAAGIGIPATSTLALRYRTGVPLSSIPAFDKIAQRYEY